MQGSLYSYFGGKQSPDDKEINKSSETSAPNKKTRRLQELWKDKYRVPVAHWSNTQGLKITEEKVLPL